MKGLQKEQIDVCQQKTTVNLNSKALFQGYSTEIEEFF